jgi:CubicO group peptidase (beta-lactamase class C family)
MRHDVSSLIQLCREEFAANGFPGAAFGIGNLKETQISCLGQFTYEGNSPKVAKDSLFDLASLTKVMATTPAAMLLYDDGLLDLDKPVVEYLPDFLGENKERVTVRNLLLHDSGLPAYATLTKYANRDEARKAVLGLKLKAKPGEQTEYS